MIRELYYNPQSINDTDVILFEFINLNPLYTISPYVYRLYPNIIENINGFKHQIMNKFNVIYDNTFSKIHVK